MFPIGKRVTIQREPDGKFTEVLLDRILQIDAALSSLFDNFGGIVRSIEPQQICLLTDLDMVLKQKYPGIYRIDVHVGHPQTDRANSSDWIRQFVEEWDHADFVGNNTPTTKLLRIRKHDELLEWMPVYIGKSTNVGSRVAQHINLPLDRRTFAMKLRARPMWNLRVFRLSTIHLPVRRYDLIAPLVEAEAREHVNPLVGRK